MSKPRVLCMVDVSGADEGMAELREVAEVDCLQPDRQVLVERIGQYDALWSHTDLKLDAEVLDRAGRLKVINTASTGTDHIDRDHAARRGIRILSITRDYGLLDKFTATAECALMLILACCRQFKAATRDVLDGNWRGPLFRGRQLSRKTLGVLGVGRLGKMSCDYGKGFRMRVLGCDLKTFEIPGVEPVDHDTLLGESDVVTIHIHMTPANYHLFNADTFAKMKDGAVLVNTSRGDIIDEAALIAALESGKLSAFGADVLHDEWRRDMGDSPIVQYARTHDNVVVTPHIGGCTHESVWDARVFSARKLARYLQSGQELTMPG